MNTTPVNDTDLLFPIMNTTPGNGISLLLPIPPRPYVDSSCSSHPPVSRSCFTFHSSTATDPRWREPAIRLQRWKEDVADMMQSLRKQGEEGSAVILRQPLRKRWQRTNFLMKEHIDFVMDDGSPLPDDLSFWKATHAFLYQEWNKIRVARGEVVGKQERMRNPLLDFRIQSWMTEVEAARDADGLEDLAEAPKVDWPAWPELPAVEAGHDLPISNCRCNITGDAIPETSPTQGRKRKSIDSMSAVDHEDWAWRKRWIHGDPGYEYEFCIAGDASDEGKILPAKQAKRKLGDTTDQEKGSTMPPSKRRKHQGQAEESGEELQSAPAKQTRGRGKKVREPAAPTRRSSRIAAKRQEAAKLGNADTTQVHQPQQTPRQPPRRSLRIAKLNKAKKK